MKLTALECAKFVDDAAAKLKTSPTGVFSSTDGTRARSRTVDFVNIGIEIGFFTWGHTQKVQEIAGHPDVSFCVGGIWIEGRASILPITDSSIKDHLSEYSARLPALYAKFTKLPGVVFVVVKPSRMNRLGVDQGALYNTTFDTASGECDKVKLSDWPD